MFTITSEKPSLLTWLHIMTAHFPLAINPSILLRIYSRLGQSVNIHITDDGDIRRRKAEFIGQVNNLLCYLQVVDCLVKCKSFCSFCNSSYGSELWLFSNYRINDICAAWRVITRKVWKPSNIILTLTYQRRCDNVCNFLINRAGTQ